MPEERSPLKRPIESRPGALASCHKGEPLAGEASFAKTKAVASSALHEGRSRCAVRTARRKELRLLCAPVIAAGLGLVLFTPVESGACRTR